MNTSFPCDGCGACCKSIRLSISTTWLDRGDGVCRHFDENHNNCLIYENRPEICNVRTMYLNHYQHDFDWEKFIVVNQMACAELKIAVTDKINVQ